ncbi:MAG: hypothetical protein ACREV5_17415 [Steroidobacter sp.]
MFAVRSLFALAVLLAPLLAQAGSLADIELYDRTAHRALPVHEHDGRLYIAGEPRHQYEVRIRSRSEARLLAVTSVDGVNVVSGKTAAEHQGGYVLDAWSSVAIDGWRKSLDEVATFYFTRLADSYAARTGRPHNVGVIGVALFREQQPCCDHLSRQESEDRGAPAPSISGEQSASAPRAQRRSNSKLGTGHGHSESSPAQYVDFRRASSTPDETIVIYYDSRRNLTAQGVLPEWPSYARRRPSPFPDGFVPDP